MVLFRVHSGWSAFNKLVSKLGGMPRTLYEEWIKGPHDPKERSVRHLLLNELYHPEQVAHIYTYTYIW